MTTTQFKLVVLGIFIAACIAVVDTTPSLQNTPRVGQVWHYSTGNPFDASADKTFTVLAVKDGWVQYRDQDGIVRSALISWFVDGATHD
jgi:hypothetical protein